MAFVEKSGKGFVVRQGNNGKILSRHSSRADAKTRVTALHKKNKPAGKFKGASAKSSISAAEKSKK